MKYKSFIGIIIMVLFFVFITENRTLCAQAPDENELYARAAVLIDGQNNRILYGKNENLVLPMASTTKIMTLVVALENSQPEDVITFSKYAASQPDVQLNAAAGEQYTMKDMLYLMMMRSYNDVAVAVAENIGEKLLGWDDDTSKRETENSKECVKAFVKLMNGKAAELGCENTYFITPNGLDATDDYKTHSTTAYELAKIASYAIQKADVEKICTTRSYSCSEISGKRNVSITTTDRFLDMVKGAVGMKTGFTGNAGYCFVGAVRQEGRTFVSVVLGSGWPPNKNYKWSDTKKLMNYGIANYFTQKVFVSDRDYRYIQVLNGKKDYVGTEIKGELTMLLNDDEIVNVVYILPDFVNAPVKEGQQLGVANIYIDGNLYESFPITAKNQVEKTNYLWFLKKIINFFIL